MARYLTDIESGNSILVTPENEARAKQAYTQNPHKYLLEMARSPLEDMQRNQPEEMAQEMQQAQESQQQQDLANEPLPKAFLRGVSRLLYPQAMSATESGANPQTTRNLMGTDILGQMAMATGSLPLIAEAAVPLNALGQMQRGQEYNPTEGAITGLLQGTPIVGGKAAGYVGKTMQNMAPDVLHYAVKPILKVMGSPNPPNFKRMLEENIFPYVGGLKSAHKAFQKKLKPLRENLEREISLADESGVRISVPEIRANAIASLDNDPRITPSDKAKIVNAIDNEIELYAQNNRRIIPAVQHAELQTIPQNIKDNKASEIGFKSASTRVKNKRLKADQKTYDELIPNLWDRGKVPLQVLDQTPFPVSPTYSDELRSKIITDEKARRVYDMLPSKAYNQKSGLQTSAFVKSGDADRGTARAHAELARAINKVFETSSPGIREATRATAPYESTMGVLERRLGIPSAHNEGMGLLDLQAMQAMGDLAGGTVKGQLAGLLARRVVSTTGGAQMLFNAGKSLQQPFTKSVAGMTALSKYAPYIAPKKEK